MAESGLHLGASYVTLSVRFADAMGGVKSFFRGVERQGGESGQKTGSLLSLGVVNALRSQSGAASQAGRSLGQRVADAAKNVLGAAGVGKALTTGLGVGGLFSIGYTITKGIGRLTAIDDARAKLRGLGHDAQSIDAIMKSALEAVKGTAFGLDEAATIAASATAAGVKEGKELTDYLKLTADAAAISGGSLGELGHVLNKARTAGKVFTDDLNMLADRGLPIFVWLQEQYHTSAEGLSKMVQKGQIDALALEKALRDHIGGAALKMGDSFSGSLSNMKAALGRFGAKLVAPVFDATAASLGKLTGLVDKAGEAVGPVVARISAQVGKYAQLARAQVAPLLPKIAAEVGGFVRNVRGYLASPAGAAFLSGLASRARDLGSALARLAQAALPTLRGLGQLAGEAARKLAPLAALALPAALDLMTGALGFLAAALRDMTGWAKDSVHWVGEHQNAVQSVASVALTVAAPALAVLAVRWAAAGAAAAASAVKQAGAWTMTQVASARSGALMVADLYKTAFGWASTAAAAVTSAGAQAGAWLAVQAASARAAISVGLATARVVAASVAQKAIAAATAAWTGAQWLLNAAMTANPLGVVIALLVAAGVALYEAYQHSETFRKIVDTALRAVGTAAKWLWNEAIKPSFEWIKRTIGDVVAWGKQKFEDFRGFLHLLSEKAAQVGDGIRAGFAGLKEIVLAPVHALGALLAAVPDTVLGISIPFAADIRGFGQTLQGLAVGGLVVPVAGRAARSRSGLLSGPGTGTSDSILGVDARGFPTARVSAGEMVVNAEATRRQYPLLAAINAGTDVLGRLRLLPAFADGGRVGGDDAGLNAGAAALRSFIMRQWPQIQTIGGRRSEDGFGEHSSGNAIDVMIPDWNTPGGAALGDEVAAFLRANQSALGVNGFIWRQNSFGYGGSFDTGKPMSDRGSPTQNHMDHVHVILGAGRGANAAPVGLPTSSITLPGGSSFSGGSWGAGSSGGYGAATPSSVSQTDVEADHSVRAAKDRIDAAKQRVDDTGWRVEQAKRQLDELNAKDPEKVKPSQREAAERRLAVAQREQAEAADKLKRAEDGLGEAREKARDKIAKTQERERKKADKEHGRGDDGGKSLGHGLVDGMLEAVGLDGSILSNPLDWTGTKMLTGLVNMFTAPAQQAQAAGAGAGFGADIGGDLSMGAIPDAVSSLAPATGPGGPYQPSPLTGYTPAAQQGDGGGPASVDQSIRFEGPVNAEPKAVAQQVQAGYNARNRGFGLTTGRYV